MGVVKEEPQKTRIFLMEHFSESDNQTSKECWDELERFG